MFEDIVIINDVLEGKASRFDDLIEKYEKIVFILIYHLIADNEASKEICKDVFIQAYNNLYRYNNRCKFSNWIFRITLCRCKKYMEKNQMKNEKFLPSLDCSDKCIIALKSIGDSLTYRDISEVLEMNESNIKERYRRTIGMYRNALRN